MTLPENHFGEEVAARYDRSSGEMFEPEVVESTVDFLAGLAGDGAALELGIGTGRIALPLARRGVRVSGIDLSEAMVARLREKPGGAEIDVAIGDFATTTVEGSFALAYLVFNTINNLTTQDAQVTCFRNVAAHLEPGGCFVIEVGVPQLQRLPPGETARPFTITPERLGFDEYDVVNQGLALGRGVHLGPVETEHPVVVVRRDQQVGGVVRPSAIRAARSAASMAPCSGCVAKAAALTRISSSWSPVRYPGSLPPRGRDVGDRE